jgi:hypothetical protein
LARGHTYCGNDAYRHPEKDRWQGRRVDGEGHRREVPQVSIKAYKEEKIQL